MSRPMLTLYYSNFRENASNILYPNEIHVTSEADLVQAVAFDHVCAKYKNSYRRNDNFLSANCTMLDVDNADSDNSANWIYPNDIQAKFPNVPFYVVYSRNHMKEKNGKEPRPKFHIYFPDRYFTDREEYSRHKEKVCCYFSAFDSNAKDSARFFYGVENPEIEYFDGTVLLADFMETVSIHADNTTVSNCKGFQKILIPEGTRHNTLLSFAVKKLIYLGDTTDEAHQLYRTETLKCVPPLDERELTSIWNSAVKYYQAIKNNKNYISPEEYKKAKSVSLKPSDFTDIGQTNVFVRECGDIVRFSTATGYLFYNGKVWLESETKVHRLVQQLTESQLKEVSCLLAESRRKENSALIEEDIPTQEVSQQGIKSAENYRRFVIKSRHTARITAVLNEAQPMLEVNTSELDKDGFLLNTPDGTIDLHTGNMNHHNYLDYCTRITATSPDEQGKDLFHNFLNTITCNNQDLIDYLQLVAGMCLIGNVYSENLIIAFGTGKNGKSTFFNLLSLALGNYAGNLSADILVKGSRINSKNEFAEIRGKRLVLASELEDGKELNTSVVKQLCSTDTIYAEKKYKDPFSFKPTHTTILCTNHLPAVSSIETGTWRRIIVIPFKATIDTVSEIKNYTEYLFQNCGGYVLSWMIAGAKKYIEAEYKITPPVVVAQAIEEYRATNDWLCSFLSDCCDIGKTFSERAGNLYKEYQSYCRDNGEFTKSQSAFRQALIHAGYEPKKSNMGVLYYGLQIKQRYILSSINRANVTDGDGGFQNISDTEGIIF